MGIQFVPTITFGNVLTLVSMFIGAVIFALSIIRRLDRIEHQHGLLWRWFRRVHHINGATEYPEPPKE